MDPRTPHEIKLGIPIRCLAVFRVLSGSRGLCPRKDGRWSTDAIVRLTTHQNDGKKARELAVACPDVVVRDYLDRKTGAVHRREEDCSKPIAMYRLAATYDPWRAQEPVVTQGVLV